MDSARASSASLERIEGTGRTLICHRHDHSLQWLALFAAPREAEVVGELLSARADVYDVGFNANVLCEWDRR